MQDNNNDFNRKIEVLLLKMLLVHQVINHSKAILRYVL